MYAPTGIPELDRALGGGFLRGKTYLIAGETGCGKTIFSMQFLLKGAALGEPGIYLAIDEPSEHVKRGLRLFGWDVSELEEEGLLLFLDMRTHFSKIYLREERRRLTSILSFFPSIKFLPSTLKWGGKEKALRSRYGSVK